MTDHRIGTREEWLAARIGLLKEEKELTQHSDKVARKRQELPWVRIDEEYRFETDKGNVSLAVVSGRQIQNGIRFFFFYTMSPISGLFFCGSKS